MTPELCEITDDQGETLQIVERATARRQGLRTRIALTAVIRSDGLLLCHRRSDDRPTMAGLWDLAAGGAVDPGEQPEAAARREVLEELGIGVACTPVWAGPWDDDTAARWIHAYVATSDDEPEFDPSEVAEVAWLGASEVELLGAQGKVCPDSWSVLWPHVKALITAA